MDSFLDLIRIVIPKKKKKDEGYLPFLREKYLSFQELLRKNNLILTIMAQLNETLIGESPFTWAFLRENITTLHRNVKGMIDDLNKLTNNKYPALYQKFEEISLYIESLIYQYEEIPVSDYTIPLNKITKEMVSLVGSKNANLGEIKNILKLPTPKGFAITAYAFRRFLEHNGLWEDIKRKVREIDINSLEELELISAYLQKCILAAELPKDLEKAIMEEVPQKYKEVVASLYSPRAIYYHKKLGLPEGKMVMSVSVMAMANAFLKGLTSLKWPEPRDFDVKGFLGMIANTATIPEEELSKKGLESYAFISKNYMNISLRLDYHLSTIEAYAGDNLNDNYIRFFFNGGGASLDRRLRRVKLITEILKHLDFQVKVTADLIDAQVLKEKKNVIVKKIGTPRKTHSLY